MRKEVFCAIDRLSDVIECDYRMVQVVCRFGIAMGFADKTISEVCHESGVDVHTFIAVINTINKYKTDTQHRVSLDLIDVRCLLNYLKHTHDYLINHQLPRMRRNLFGAMDFSTHNEIELLLVKYFDMYTAEVQQHVRYEETEVHKYVKQLLDGLSPDDAKISLHRHNENFVNKLHELITLFLQYYPQDNSNDILNDVVYDIYRVEEDIKAHCIIEDEVLIPLIRKLERRRTQTASNISTPQNTAIDTRAVALSEREQAVAICVAKGMSNKEIAQQLSLSVNTVTTHRRNIARKLNIHSAAGIAIYCVVNKLVTLEEIKYSEM